MKKSVLLLISMILIPLFSLQAEEKKHDILSSKPPAIESVDITPNPVGRGDIFTMTIIVDHNSSEEVDFPLEDLPEELRRWRGPYIRSFIDTDKNDNSVRKVRITTTFKAQRSGRMIVPALSVMAEGRELKTDPMLLKVGLYKNRKLYMPIEAEWQAGFDKIYAGEAVPVSLMVRNQEVVVIFDRTRVAYPRDGFFEEAGGIAEITSISEGDIILYDIPAATYLYTAPVAGSVKIPSAGVDYNGITGWTDNFYLDILKTPSEIKETGAIGDFTYYSAVDKTSAAVGENFSLTATVEGSGNLNFLKIPAPEVEGAILVSAEEVDDYKAGPNGFSGSKSVSWIYTAENAGATTINIPEFTYLYKKTDEIITLPGKIYNIELKADAVVELDEALEIFPFTTVEIPDYASPAWNNNYLNLFRYIWLLPGFIFFILVLILKGRRLTVALILTAVIMIAVYSIGRFAFGTEIDLAETGINADVLYNQAVQAYEQDRVTDSIHYLRTAVYTDPVNSLYREALDWIEAENGFANSVEPSLRMHPDIFYYMLIVSVNLLFFSAVFRMFKSGGGVYVLIILFVFLVVFSASMIFYVHSARADMTAVVSSEDGFLKKIPRDTAGDWVLLEPGTALNVLDQSGNFMLVETGLGVKGWIQESFLTADRLNGSFR